MQGYCKEASASGLEPAGAIACVEDQPPDAFGHSERAEYRCIRLDKAIL